MKSEFIIERQGKQFVLFAGLLAEAHDQGLLGIETDLLQVPEDSNDNVAIVKAVAHMPDSKKFGGLGDASPANVGKMIQPHIIRMAETRAKARALRDAINVGMTALEELSEDEGVSTPTKAPKGSQTANERPQKDNVKPLKGGATKAKKWKMKKPQRDEIFDLVGLWKDLHAPAEVVKFLTAFAGASDSLPDDPHDWTGSQAQQVIGYLNTKVERDTNEEVELDEDDLEEIDDIAGGA